MCRPTAPSAASWNGASRISRVRRVNRIDDFRRWLQRAAAERTIETPNGTGIVTASTPDVYDANYLSVDAPARGVSRTRARPRDRSTRARRGAARRRSRLSGGAAEDWPRELYAKLGFTVVGRRDVYTR